MNGSPLRVGMLGFGTVGQAVARALVERGQDITRRAGRPIRLHRIAVRDPQRERPWWPDDALVHTDAVDVVEQGDIDVVLEVMGGEQPALTAVRRAMERRLPVVTANKLVMARHAPSLLALADERGVRLLFEAAVGGAIPIIRPIRESLASDRILALGGIVNGTTNFVLTEMEEGGTSLDTALDKARGLGYAEADARADLSGQDAACKLAVLASLAFDGWVPPDDVHVSGIEHVELQDVQYARELGYVVKLLATAKARDGRVEAWVGPAMLPRRHPLAQVRGVNNAILLSTEAAGDLMFYGPGAGGNPTAAAVLGDLMDVARRPGRGPGEGNGDVRWRVERRLDVADAGSVVSSFYVRLQVNDRPGVLAAVAAVFGRNQVSIQSVIQKGRGTEPVDLVLVTHEASYRAVRQVVGEVAGLDVVVETGHPMWVVGNAA